LPHNILKGLKKMKSLLINNYKNIKHLSVDKLGRVNLIWGKNNVGKSTLLEALTIFAANGRVGQLYEILKRRGENLSAFRFNANITSEDELNSFLPLVSDYDKSILETGGGIQVGESDENKVSIKLVRVNRVRKKEKNKTITARVVTPVDSPIEDNTISSHLSLQMTNHAYLISYVVDLNGQGVQDSDLMDPEALPINIPYRLISSKGEQQTALDKLWSSVSMSENEDYVIKALQIIEPRIKRFNILTSDSIANDQETVPFVLLEGENNRVRLGSMGDGINRVLTIILSLINCKDGIFLLDEFENGLHYSVQSKLWDIIFEIAELLDIQVFVTTHSNDCISSFAHATVGKDGLAIRLDQNGEGLKAQLYDNPDDLIFAMNESIELR